MLSRWTWPRSGFLSSNAGMCDRYVVREGERKGPDPTGLAGDLDRQRHRVALDRSRERRLGQGGPQSHWPDFNCIEARYVEIAAFVGRQGRRGQSGKARAFEVDLGVGHGDLQSKKALAVARRSPYTDRTGRRAYQESHAVAG